MTATWQQQRDARLRRRLQSVRSRVPSDHGIRVTGELKRVVGLTLEVAGCHMPLGGRCKVRAADGGDLEAEVVGFSGDRLYLMPTTELRGLLPHAPVIPLQSSGDLRVGPSLLGRVLDGEGHPLDGGPPPRGEHLLPVQMPPLNPLTRQPIRTPLDVGVRSINALLTVGRGQRIGLFAGSGVGKSTLLGMMTRHTAAEIVVVALVGERGREVQEFVQNTLGQGLRRAVVVATPADRPPLMRLHGAWLATRIAEHFREQGKQVLLLMDSLTRVAQAQREIGLAVGEPPTTRGYPPSVFAQLPRLVERAGNSDCGDGSITAFYTVLTEGDDPQDPVADTARAILDGHIVLSRAIAESGLFPAIDIEASVSRVADDLIDPNQRRRVRELRQLFSAYSRQRDLILVGAYQKGSDPRVDRALALWPGIQDFLTQDRDEAAGYAASHAALARLLEPATA